MIAITLNHIYIAVHLTKYRIFTCIPDELTLHIIRIRMQCSELLYHLYQNHVADSPSCPCGVIETPKHYFFDCPLHHIAKEELNTAELFRLQLTPTLNTVLFGDAPAGNLPELVIAVETFITTTQRFTLTMLNLPD